ncbi:MAG: TonB-dependent receptor [Colwellia sp.]|nr:TonB-dependent receptor [Colwellia sp.]
MKFKNTPVALALFAALSTSHVYAEETLATEKAEEEVERIVVTGSRIARINTHTPSPIVSIDAAAIKGTGVLNINELLTQLPQFALGTDSSSGNSSFGNAGLNTVNLRNLGADRTLILVNGRRIVRSTYDDGFMTSDTGYIPVDLLERVDILTGGAASTYGADAVAGVVNFVMKKEYEGTRVSAQYGKSDIGDGEETSITLTSGHNFNNDKGNIVFSLDYYDAGSASLMDRPGSGEQTAWLNNPLNTGEPDDGQPSRIAGYNLAWPDYNVYGQMAGIEDANGIINYYNVTGNQSAYMYNDNDFRSPYYVQEGENAEGWNINRYNKVQSPYERATFYTLFNYELSDELQLTADLRYSKITSQNQISPVYNYWIGEVNDSWFDQSIERPAHIAELLDQSDGWFYSSIGLNELGPRTSDVERELFAFSSSLAGEFSNGWLWDAYISSGKTKHDTVLSNRTNQNRFSNSHDSITNDNGDYCGVDVFDCPSSHPLIPMTQEALDYITLDPYGSQITSEQNVFSAAVSGDILELPHGELMFAAGIDVRRESIEMEVDDTWQSGLGGNMKQPWDAAKTVQEVFLELEAPILADIFLIDELVLNVAGRMSTYTYAGTNNTWKLGATWSIIEGLAMRSTYAHTARAPQLSEQFSAVRTGFSNGKEDPCDSVEILGASAENKEQIIANCQSWGIADPVNFDSQAKLNGGVDVTTTGNINLQPEKADTLTVGIVYTPSFIDNLSLTIDYYDIDITDVMGGSGIQNTLDKCAREEDVTNSIYCPLVVRGSDGNVLDVLNTTVNQAYTNIKGVDFEASYLLSLNEYGQIDFSFNATKLLDSSYSDSDEDEIHDVTGIGYNNVELKARFVMNYSYEDLTANWTTNYAEGFQVSEYGTYELYDKPFAPHSIMHNARVSYTLNDNANIYLGINNVFDKSYYNHPSTSYGRSQYDSMGRYFYTGFSYEF